MRWVVLVFLLVGEEIEGEVGLFFKFYNYSLDLNLEYFVFYEGLM